VKWRAWNTIKFAHMALGLVPKVLDSIEVICFISEQFTLGNSVMLKLRYI